MLKKGGDPRRQVPEDIDLRLPLGDAGEAEPAPGIPQGALQRFPHLPGGAGGVEGGEGGIGNQQFLRIVEAAQAGGAVRCAGDDGHEGIIGAVGVADYIVGGGGGPVQQEALGIVAKGGNMALNVSPQPDGRIPVDAMESLYGFGAWLKTYGEAIYGTRAVAPYQYENRRFTQKGDAVYAFRLYPIAQESVEAKIFIPYAKKASKVTMLDDGTDVSFTETEGGITVTVPAGRRTGSAPIALVFKIQ